MLPRRSMLFGLATLAIIGFGPRSAPAAPVLFDASPPDGAIVERPPERVFIRFRRGIDSRSTRIELAGPTGSSSLLIERTGGEPLRELSIPVPDQGIGAYVVRWEIRAGGGKRTKGKIRFVVRR